jgi:hypothetical protein
MPRQLHLARIRTFQDGQRHYNRPGTGMHDHTVRILHAEHGPDSALQLHGVGWHPGVDGTVEADFE